MTQIILATSSPYRQEAFRFLDLDFVAQWSDIDEYFEWRPEDPQELVLHLARLKAEAIIENYKEGIIIGFDTVGLCNWQVLEKPKSRKEAFERLQTLSDNKHQLFTGIYMKNLDSGKELSKHAITKAEMRKLSDQEINKYLDQDPRFKTYALGYDTLGHYSSSFVIKIEWSYNNLTRGIPMETIMEMLFEIWYKLR